MTEYYDVVLGVIPVSLIGIAAMMSTLGFPLEAAVPAGAVVSVGVIGHAMFVNGPVEPVPSDPDDLESAVESDTSSTRQSINAD